MSTDPLPKLSAPASRALAEAGITTLEQAAEYGQAALLRLHGFGPRGIEILRGALAGLGMELAD